MTRYKLYMLCSLIFVLVSPLNAQIDKHETVTINLGQPDHNGLKFPFDIHFYMDGEVATECYKIDFRYKVDTAGKKKLRNWMTFPPVSPADFYQASSWTRSSEAEKKFILSCPGIHPNIHYDFEFILYKDLKQTDDERGKLKTKIASVLKTFFASFANSAIQQNDILVLQNSINTVVRTHLGINGLNKSLRQKADPTLPFSFNINSSAPAAVAQVIASSGAINDAHTNLNDAPGTPGYKTLVANELSSIGPRLYGTIDSLLENKLKLNKFSKDLLTIPITPGLPEFKDYKLIDGIKLLRSLTLSPSQAGLIFDGTSKISNNSFVNSGERHFQSIYYLEALVNELEGGVIKDSMPGNNDHEVFDYLGTLLTFLQQAATEYRSLETAEKKLAEINNTLPDLTAGLIIVESQTAEVISFPDVVSEHTPYISAEGGIGYSTGLETGYSYFGANFYLSPINKKAPLSNFKGWNLIRKVVCFNVGIGNFYGTRRANTYSILGKSSGSDLLLGIGFRLGRVVKLNISTLPYRTDNDNPLSGKYRVDSDLAFSIGADVNILKAFSSVAKGLKLID